MGIRREERSPKSLSGAICLREAFGGFCTSGGAPPLFLDLKSKIGTDFETLNQKLVDVLGEISNHNSPQHFLLRFYLEPPDAGKDVPSKSALFTIAPLVGP